MRLVLTLTLYSPTVTGPSIYIPNDRITAVHQANATSTGWRSVVHLIGGEQIAVCEDPETIMREAFIT